MGAGESESLGQALSRARRERGLTIQQIADTTKIPARHLEALERDDLAAVPAGMYLRAEIRAYADAVGMNRSVALGYLPSATPVAVVPEPVAPPVTATSSKRAALWGAVVGTICVITIVTVIWRPRADGVAPSPSRPLSSSEAATPPVVPAAATADHTVPPPAPVVLDAASAPSGTTGSATTLDSPIDLPQVEHPPVQPVVVEPELEIVSDPPGARVTIDGVGWGITPVTIRYLPPGIKQLRVTKDGYAAEVRAIRFSTSTSRTSVRIDLHPIE